MPGLLELIVAMSALSLVATVLVDADAPTLDDAALASAGWL